MRDTIDLLKNLAQLDMDAWHAYGDAMEHIEDMDVHRKLSEFREDHRRHVDRISEQIRKMGEQPPEFSRDFKGFFIQGMTKMLSSTGSKGALKAMETNEKLTTKKYRESLEGLSDPELRSILQAHYEDEQRHLAFVQDQLGRK